MVAAVVHVHSVGSANTFALLVPVELVSAAALVCARDKAFSGHVVVGCSAGKAHLVEDNRLKIVASASAV